MDGFKIVAVLVLPFATWFCLSDPVLSACLPLSLSRPHQSLFAPGLTQKTRSDQAPWRDPISSFPLIKTRFAPCTSYCWRP